MYTALAEAMADVSIDWDQCPRQDRGDGAQVLFPPEVPKERIGGPLVTALDRRVRWHNAQLEPAAVPLQLRAALHAGEVQRDPFGWAGHTLAVVGGLLGSGELRSVVHQADGASLALIVSGVWYEAVVRQEHAGIRADSYREVRVSTEVFSERGWVHVPGYRRPPVPEPAPPSPPADPPAPSAEAGGTGGPGRQQAGGISFGNVQNQAGRDIVGGIVFGNQTVYRDGQ